MRTITRSLLMLGIWGIFFVIANGYATEAYDKDRLFAALTSPPSEKLGKRWINQIIGGEPVHLILVEKDLQRIQVLEYNGKALLVAEYPCATGINQGKKESSGDARTPEGIYFITKVYHDSKITVFGKRAFHLDYPNAFDKTAGRNGDGIYIHGTNKELKPNSTNGCITMKNEDLDELMGYLKKDVTPVVIITNRDMLTPKELNFFEKKPNLAKMLLLPDQIRTEEVDFDYLYFITDGVQVVAVGEFFYEEKEGVPVNGYSRSYLENHPDGGWTPLDRVWHTRPSGDSAPMDVVIAATEDKKSIIAPPEPIKKKVEFPYPMDEKKVLDFVEQWRQAWQNKNIDDFISCYNSTFRKDGMDIKGWRAYKERLNRSYKTIRVDVSDVKVEWLKTGVSVFFKQSYKSDRYAARGYKQLYLSYNDGKWAITKELWIKGKN